ncbi:hypothetical protein PENTCL1PPCAC_14281 [Pristionchus entomophagus]|uniref:Dehydrogenase n=1 Tax=Pristionchus entomophagus TaxID=358040 RepID=A0AAV5TGH4_9BILA|nr:hypothetical protein PENTCL1PPCAC_14281 [Pristionchus entomophagus]
MLSVLVTGTNRGLGRGLVGELLNAPTVGIVIATVRNVEVAKELMRIDSPKLHVITCEVTDENSVAAAVKKASQIVGGKGLDILINNACIKHRVPLNGDVTKAMAMEQLEVNTVGPLLMATRFHGLLKRAAELNGSAQIINISSASGSLEQALRVDWGPPSLYSISKAALNMLTRKLALEWKADKIRATAFTPGWVRTDERSANADQSVEEASAKLIKMILSLTEDNNGEFYGPTGNKIPW